MPQLGYKAEIISHVRRMVVKVGSGVLSDGSGLRTAFIRRLAADIDKVMETGREVVIVSSGAIAAGHARMRSLRAGTLAARQAAAATGQIDLMTTWTRAFSARRRTIAQILLTHRDLAERRRRLNASQTIVTLLRAGVVPVVNENDTVAVEEIRLGDNDILSSLVASLVQADLLVLLTDVSGVLTGDPRTDSGARLIPLISDPEAAMRGLVTDSSGPLGSGGMATKLKAARQAARAGIAVLIADGRTTRPISRALDPSSQSGTLFVPARTRLGRRKSWIAFALRPSGALRVDRGAAEAIRRRGRSLLASGIREVRGDFLNGDCVSLLDPEGVEFGRGLVNYPAPDVLKLKGRHSREISQLLGYKIADEIIHRDNFVLIADIR